MKKGFITYKDVNYPTRVVRLPENCGYNNPVIVADYDLFAAIEQDYDKGKREAVEIDNDIFFYCDSGFIASDPTDKQIVDYLVKCGI